jgi:8-oxo-dGTP pyrophosphatase MutT (NUDIX family)
VTSRKEPPAWTRVREGEPLDFTILKVREDTVADPRDGSLHPRVRISCTDWVNVVPYTADGRLVLVRQFRTGVWANTLELPGGMVDPGEAPERAAVRELEEETGYVAGRVVDLGWVHPNPAFQDNRCHTFLALDCVPGPGGQAQDAGEDIQVELHPVADVPGLLRGGVITHALVVVAFHLERLWRDAGGR